MELTCCIILKIWRPSAQFVEDLETSKQNVKKRGRLYIGTVKGTGEVGNPLPVSTVSA